MSNKSNPITIIQKLGLILFIFALGLFTAMLGLESYKLTEESIVVKTEYHKTAVRNAAESDGMLGKTYSSNFEFIADYRSALKKAQDNLNRDAESLGIPAGVDEWNYKLGDWEFGDYVLNATKKSSIGLISNNNLLFLLLTVGLGILGGLLYILPKFNLIPGIKNNHIYHNPMTRGLKLGSRGFFLLATTVGVLLYGFFYMKKDLFWPLVTTVIIALIIGLVLFYEKQKRNNPAKSASPELTGWLGIFTGVYLISFYILLYWFPEYLTSWILMVDPVSEFLSGNEAGRWFLYGLLYTLVILVMGLRMIAKYRHNKYQIVRTISVMFFQTAFAFLIPEILARLNKPYFDIKHIWPLDYDFFFDIDGMLAHGTFGVFMLVWGIALFLIAVPLFTYFYGKRWYCSWVCGCGGLAETLGDPYRQLSDKSLRAWKYERWIIHGVLVFAVVMTAMVIYTYLSGQYNIWIFNSDTVRTWYGFLIGAAFAGVVGTGFYPLMGNRVWCRFGCPLAAYLGLIQKFKSRFRITVNGGQCISCGNCSTYCEMGIDVRAYAQKGQDVVRASCVGCGICAAVCPRGVLRLENGPEVGERTKELKAIHISEDDVVLLN